MCGGRWPAAIRLFLQATISWRSSLSMQSMFLQSSEGEGEGLHARIQEFNLESPIFYSSLLADQLIQAMFLHRAGAAGIGVAAVIVAGRGAVDFHHEAHRLAVLRGSKYEVQIARVKAVQNPGVRGLRNRIFEAYIP